MSGRYHRIWFPTCHSQRITGPDVTITQVQRDTVLELTRVSKQFGSQRSVDNVSLQIGRGEFFSLLGPSGCGKTTTLRMIAGFEEPTSGEIRLNGQSIQHLKPSSPMLPGGG